MKQKSYILLLLIANIVLTVCASLLFFKEKIYLAVILSLVFLAFFIYTFNFIRKILQEVEDFSEAIKYRDLSRRYTEKKGIKGINFHRQFNEISNAFYNLAQEKEMQQQYLQKILELVDTGIMAYDTTTLDVIWMNEAVKNILNIPEFKNLRWLNNHNTKLFKTLTGLPLKKDEVLTLNIQNQTIKTVVNTSDFRTEDRSFRIIAFHNINSTMEEIEANAWRGLLSVMTHEIMNSIAPVSSLADTLKKQIEHSSSDSSILSKENLDDLSLGMDTIKRRSEGLLRFANTYQHLSKTIIPQMSITNIENMLNNIFMLMQPSLQQKQIHFEMLIKEPISEQMIDRNLIEQVLINFLTNSVDALQNREDPQIILSAGNNNEGNVYITVADNGKGIPSDLLEKIFIPFFSTKKNGNGIGLSLCRQIVKIHDAKLKVQTKENAGTAFTIVFKK